MQRNCLAVWLPPLIRMSLIIDLVKWEILKLVESLAIDYYFLVPVGSRQTTIDGHKTDFIVSWDSAESMMWACSIYIAFM